MAVADLAKTRFSLGHADTARRLARSAWLVMLAGLLPAVAWIGWAPLSMAIVAPAFVKVDLNRRPVQHREGGIVREVLVRDGKAVVQGEPVLILGDIGVDADRDRLMHRVQVERAASTRLEAEQRLADHLVFPAALVAAGAEDEQLREALTKEMSLFQAKRQSLGSESALIKVQRERIEQEVGALESQINQAQISLGLQRQDLEANRGLLEKQFISEARIVQLEATVADYASRLEERRSELARARQRLIDNDLKLRTLQNQYVQTASDQLKETAARLGEIEQELRKSEDAASRQVVTAPASGEVINLRFTSPGAVVGAGEPIAEIVPSNVELKIDARIRPEEVNHVHVDQRARIKFTAFKYRNTAMAVGHVTYISADRLVDRASDQPYYSVTVAVEPESLRQAGDIKLLAGMPAEVFIEGTQQTALQYLVEPITAVLRKSAREL